MGNTSMYSGGCGAGCSKRRFTVSSARQAARRKASVLKSMNASLTGFLIL
jgi:hypothetical protein